MATILPHGRPGDSEVFPQLVKALPTYISNLTALASRFCDNLDELTSVPPGMPDEPSKAGVATKPIARPAEQPVNQSSESLPQHEVGNKKLNSKPSSRVARFSTLTGPEIYYDGESQKVWHDTWMGLNQHRGQLQKIMRANKPKRLMLLSMDFGGDSDYSSEEDEDGEPEPEEVKEQRREEARKQKEAEKKKAEEDRKKAEISEFIDNCLDKAARASENAAFIWLKGEGVAGHATWVVDRLQDALNKIHEVLGKPEVEEDEGFEEADEEEMDGELYPENGDDSEAELKHKIPANRRRIPGAPDPRMRPKEAEALS